MTLTRLLVLASSLLLALAGPAPARVPRQVMDASGDGAGTALGFPLDIVVDSQGTVYVTSSAPAAVFRVPQGGPPTVFVDASGDGAGNVLDAPTGLALDAADNLYVVAAASDNVFKVTPGGVVTEIMDATGDGAGNAFNCSAVCFVTVDSTGVVYVSEDDGPLFGDTSQIFRIPPGGPITMVLDSGGGGTGADLGCAFEGCRMAVDADDNVYVASPRGDQHVFRIDPAGVVTTLGDPEVGFPTDVVVDSLGRVAACGTGGLARYDAGVWTTLLDESGGNGIEIGEPFGVDVDAGDNLYVASAFTSNVLRVNPTGVTEILDASGDGQGNGFACTTSGRCTGPAVWPTDPPRVYVAGTNSDNVFEIAFQCPGTPRTDCRRPIAANAAKLQLKNGPGGEKDSITLKLRKVAATTLVELGNPTVGTDYSLCLYDDAATSPRLMFEGSAPAGGLCGSAGRACWKATATGFSYKDAESTPDGVKKMVLRSGADGKAKGSVTGYGTLLAGSLPMPALPLTVPVRAQLQVPGGVCWEAEFDAPLRNDAGQFSAKGE